MIDNVCRQIVTGHAFAAPRNNLYDRVMSGPVNRLFYPLCVKAKAFHVSEDCIGCGKCVKLCPLNNITLENGKPVWGRKIIHIVWRALVTVRRRQLSTVKRVRRRKDITLKS